MLRSKKKMKNTNEPTFLTGLVLVLLVSTATFSSDVYLPSLPEMARCFSISPQTAQATLTVYMLGFACSVLLSGSLSDRWGRKKVLSIGLSLHCLASIACLFSPSILFLICARFLQALGGCCGTVLARVIVRDSYDQNTSVKMLSSLSAGLSMALVTAPVLGGVIQTHFGWRGSFVLVSIFSLSLLILSCRFIPETLHPKDRGNLKLKTIIASYGLALKNKNFIGYTLIISLAWGAFFAFVSASPFIFIKTYHFSPRNYGLAYGFTILSYILGALIARKYSHKTSVYQFVRAAVVLSFCAGIFLVLAPLFNYTLLYVCTFIFLYIGAIGLVMPNCQAGAISDFKTSIGTVSSLFYFIEMIFGAIFSFAVGHLFNGNFILSTVTLMCASGVLMLLVLGVLSPKAFKLKVRI